VVSKAASRRASTIVVVVAATKAAEPSIHMRDKGKRKIVDRMEEEKSCKFQVYPLVEQEAMAIQAKRQQYDKRIT